MSTYRSDHEALQHRVDAVTREAEKLRAENAAIRAQVIRDDKMLLPTSLPPGAVYTMDVRGLPLAERARLAKHTVTPFPVWAVGVFNVLTLGLFSLIHFGLIHDRLPRAAHNDPTSGKAIGFTFIPYYNLYWVFFNATRLCNRLTLQLRLRGRWETAPKGMVIAACVFTVIPYINLLALPILWTIAACMLQATVNEVAALSPTEWDATPSPYDKPGQSAPTDPSYMMSEQDRATAARARKLVRWSNILGWGGFGFLVFGTFGAGMLLGGFMAGVAALIAGGAIIAGAVVGQIGRGLQGRAI